MTKTIKIILAVTGASLLTSLTASAAVYSNSFTFADNTTNFGDGSTSQSTNGGGGYVQGNQLRLTTQGVQSTNSSITVPALANSSLGWTATFSYTMSTTGTDPADGWSFNYGNITLGSLPGPDPEEGWNRGSATTYVAAMVDTYLNADINNAPDVGIATNIGGVNTVLADQNGIVLPNFGSISGTVTITFHPTNGLSFQTTGQNNNASFTNIALPGFTGNDAYTFALGARTGGATQSFAIDNLVITTVPEASSSALAALAGLGLLSTRRRK